MFSRGTFYLRNSLYAHPIFHGITSTCQLRRMTSQSLGREIIQLASSEKAIDVAKKLLTNNSLSSIMNVGFRTGI